jgi:hypothetical protein
LPRKNPDPTGYDDDVVAVRAAVDDAVAKFQIAYDRAVKLQITRRCQSRVLRQMEVRNGDTVKD